MEQEKSTLGGFEAILDSFIPNPEGGFKDIQIDDVDPIDDDDLDNIKKNQTDPIANRLRKRKKKMMILTTIMMMTTISLKNL